MNGKRAIILASAIFFLGHILYYYPHLPEKMATHFNFAGEPDGWMPKGEFIWFNVGLMIFILALFFLMGFFLPKMPHYLINLPNKDYWLAPERRAETLRRMQGEMETFYIALFLLLVSMNHLIFRANLHNENLSPASWVIVGAFLLYTFVWAIGLHKKFKIYER